jgi:hypothetical protein
MERSCEQMKHTSRMSFSFSSLCDRSEPKLLTTTLTKMLTKVTLME